MHSSFIPHTPGNEAIAELALRLYPTVMDSFREAVSNAFDEGSKRVRINVSKSEVVVEDWGNGISDPYNFAKYGHTGKKSYSSEVVGRKGLGKLSLLRINPEVRYKSNNGQYDYDIKMDLLGFHNPDPQPLGTALQHRGTKIIILHPNEIPKIDDLTDYLRKVFCLKIARGYEILLNNNPLTVPRGFINPEEKTLYSLKGGLPITGNLEQGRGANMGMVDVFVNHVFVERLLVDASREFRGWVNCDVLEPDTNRNHIVQDTTFTEFINKLKEHITMYPLHEVEDMTKAETRMGNELARMLKQFMKEEIGKINKSLVAVSTAPGEKVTVGQNILGVSPTHREEKGLGGVPNLNPDAKDCKIHTSVIDPNKKVKRRLNTDYNIEVVFQEYGNEREPIFFVYPSTLVVNITNDLYQFAMKDKIQLGPRWLRVLPWFARAAAHMSPQFNRWSKEQADMAVDQAFRYFLKLRGEMA